MTPKMGILSIDYGSKEAPRQTVAESPRFPKNVREIAADPSVSKMDQLFKLIAAGNWSDFW